MNQYPEINNSTVTHIEPHGASRIHPSAALSPIIPHTSTKVSRNPTSYQLYYRKPTHVHARSEKSVLHMHRSHYPRVTQREAQLHRGATGQTCARKTYIYIYVRERPPRRNYNSCRTAFTQNPFWTLYNMRVAMQLGGQRPRVKERRCAPTACLHCSGWG